jgi:hypothetical protein
VGNISRQPKPPGAGIPSLADIGRSLEDAGELLRRHAAAAPRPAAPPDTTDQSGITPALIRAIIASRRLRYDYLGVARGDPVWSMLLELYAARLEGRRVYQTMLGTAAGVAPTTALRLTRAMVEEGIFVAETDPADKRLLVITLSEDAAYRIGAYFQMAIRGGVLVP